ncbi:hypothetical protein M3Y94_01287200 [Aphelenchoides besseyi]|nr:hypothetical protein M3Y94_01287200 [Aphelenchoides besseyi]
MTRTNLEDDDLTGRIDAFNEFVRNNTQNFTNAMPNLWSSIPADVVKSLRTDYGFDVDSMHNNTFYLLYSTHSWFNDTSLEYSSQRYSINGKEMMAKFSYRGSNPWNLLTPRYIERVLILGV